MKLFPGTEDRAGAFSPVDVCEEISSQTKARKELQAHYTASQSVRL